MTDSSATAVYNGQGLTVSGWQAGAERQNARPEVDDMTDGHEANAVRLEGETGQVGGFGNTAGSAVPNLNVTRVSVPCKTRGLPADVATNQNALTTARPRAHR